MKRILLGIIFILAQLAHAQSTSVSGTVQDPLGIPYAQGTISATLIVSGSPTINGIAYTPPTQPSGLDNKGKFLLSLAPNASISPGGSQWKFSVCSASGTVIPAIGTGSQCFTAGPITISGSSQDISATLNAQAAALTVLLSGGGAGVTSLFGQSGVITRLNNLVTLCTTDNGTTIISTCPDTAPEFDISGTGPLTYTINYTSGTPLLSGANQTSISADSSGNPETSINGAAYTPFVTANSFNSYISTNLALNGCPSASNGQLLFDDGGNCNGASGAIWNKTTNVLTVGSGNFLSNTPVTPPDVTFQGTNPVAFVIGQTTPATSILNQSSSVLELQSTYWTGSASASDIWYIYNANYPVGSNPRSTLVFNHTGANGNSNGSNYDIVISGDNTFGSTGNCGHQDPLFTSNSTQCMVLISTNTSGSGSDLELLNGAASGSNRTRFIQSGSVSGNFIANVFETDPQTLGNSDFAAVLLGGGSAVYPYLYVSTPSANLPDLYLGGYPYTASKAALKISIDNTQGTGPVRRALVPFVPLDFDSGITTYLFSGKEVSTPGVTPAVNFEDVYLKAGKGICAFDSSSVERCSTSLTTQTNSVNNASQTTLNLLNSAAFNGLTLTFTNTSGGSVQAGFSGTLGNTGLTNSSTTVDGQTCTLGGTCTTLPVLTWAQLGGAGGSATTASGAVNSTRVWAYQNQAAINGATKFAYEVQTPDNTADTYDIGLYNSSGTLICHVGSSAGTALYSGIGMKVGTWPSCNIPQGQVYLAITAGTAATAILGGLQNSPTVSCAQIPATNFTTSGGALNSSVTFNANALVGTCTLPNFAVSTQ